MQAGFGQAIGRPHAIVRRRPRLLDWLQPRGRVCDPRTVRRRFHSAGGRGLADYRFNPSAKTGNRSGEPGVFGLAGPSKEPVAIRGRASGVPAFLPRGAHQAPFCRSVRGSCLAIAAALAGPVLFLLESHHGLAFPQHDVGPLVARSAFGHNFVADTVCWICHVQLPPPIESRAFLDFEQI